MTEFNLKEILIYLNDRLFEDIDDSAKVDGDYNVDLSEMDQYIEKHTSNVSEVVEYAYLLETDGKRCITCRGEWQECENTGNCVFGDPMFTFADIADQEESEFSDWQCRYVIEDFK